MENECYCKIAIRVHAYGERRQLNTAASNGSSYTSKQILNHCEFQLLCVPRVSCLLVHMSGDIV